MLTELVAQPATAMARTDRPIDLVHLSRMTMGERSLEQEVLHLFMRQSDLLIGRMATGCTAEAFQAAAHTLKGSARGIGAWGVAEAAEAAEARGPAGLEALKAEVERANAAIRVLIQQ
jgi:HPt (histidine-containing phosphotransfer) domain-containing protein